MLQQLFGNIVIPQAVYNELMNGGMLLSDIKKLSWIAVKPIEDSKHCQLIQNELDIGEAESILLAQEINASLLLIDERRGRQVAKRLGLQVSGVLGLLMEAKKRNLVPDVRPMLDHLMLHAGFWIHKDLYSRILQEAGE